VVVCHLMRYTGYSYLLITYWLNIMVRRAAVFQTASILIRKHGEHADLVAAMLAESFLEAGETDGSKVWNGVLMAIKELRRVKPVEGRVIN